MTVLKIIVASTNLRSLRKSCFNNLPGLASSLFSLCAFTLALISLCQAQPGVKDRPKELPIIEKPRERSVSERVTIRSVPAQPTKGVLAVVLDPIVNGKVTVKDLNGRIHFSSDTGDNGQAEFQLQRNKVYYVEVSSPGFVDAGGKTKALGATEVMRVKLIPQFATLKLRGLPPNSKVLINETQRATSGQSGLVTINDIPPGDLKLLIRHPEYNDYTDKLDVTEAGATYNLTVRMAKVTKLTIRSLPNAVVLIDGAFEGRVEKNGTVQIDYELEQAGEHTITVELIGHQTWSRREMLSPGARMIAAELVPIVTSAGVSDFFDNLSQWNAPPSWKIINKKLEIGGSQLGTLKDKTYRDFEATFTIWLDDCKGATWAVRADKQSRNYYLFHIAGPKSTTHTPDRFYTYLVRDGGEPIEADTPYPMTIDLNQPGSYTITVTVQGHTIKHSITGNETAEGFDIGIWTDTTDTKDKFLYGTLGFRSLSGEVFTIDDLSIEPLKQQ